MTIEIDLDSAFLTAKKIEIDGKEFYERAAKEARSEVGREVFLGLAKDEELHIKAIERIYEEIKGSGKIGGWITGVKQEASSPDIFSPERVPHATEVKDDIDALRFALSLEEKSIDFYDEKAKGVVESKLRRFFLLLSYEERGHYLRILDAIEFLTNPESFLMTKERSMRDGG